MRIHYVLTLLALAAPTARAQSPVAALPLDTSALSAFADSIARGTFGKVDGIRVIQNGVVRFSRDFPRSYEGVYPMTDRSGPFNYHDARWHPYHTGSARHTLQSVTKSVTSLVYGIAIARGDIKRIDAPIATYLPSYSGAFDDARKKRITIRHLLAMTSSIRWPEGGAYALRINVRRNRISVNRTRDLLYRRPWPGERTAIALGRSGRHVPPASTTSHLSTHASSSCRSLCRNA